MGTIADGAILGSTVSAEKSASGDAGTAPLALAGGGWLLLSGGGALSVRDAATSAASSSTVAQKQASGTAVDAALPIVAVSATSAREGAAVLDSIISDDLAAAKAQSAALTEAAGLVLTVDARKSSGGHIGTAPMTLSSGEPLELSSGGDLFLRTGAEIYLQPSIDGEKAAWAALQDAATYGDSNAGRKESFDQLLEAITLSLLSFGEKNGVAALADTLSHAIDASGQKSGLESLAEEILAAIEVFGFGGFAGSAISVENIIGVIADEALTGVLAQVNITAVYRPSETLIGSIKQ